MNCGASAAGSRPAAAVVGAPLGRAPRALPLPLLHRSRRAGSVAAPSAAPADQQPQTAAPAGEAQEPQPQQQPTPASAPAVPPAAPMAPPPAAGIAGPRGPRKGKKQQPQQSQQQARSAQRPIPIKGMVQKPSQQQQSAAGEVEWKEGKVRGLWRGVSSAAAPPLSIAPPLRNTRRHTHSRLTDLTQYPTPSPPPPQQHHRRRHNTTTAATTPPPPPPLTPPLPPTQHHRRHQHRNNTINNKQQQQTPPSTTPSTTTTNNNKQQQLFPEGWDEMDLPTKMYQLYAGKRGALFWSAQAAWYSAIGLGVAWIVFRCAVPGLAAMRSGAMHGAHAAPCGDGQGKGGMCVCRRCSRRPLTRHARALCTQHRLQTSLPFESRPHHKQQVCRPRAGALHAQGRPAAGRLLRRTVVAQLPQQPVRLCSTSGLGMRCARAPSLVARRRVCGR